MSRKKQCNPKGWLPAGHHPNPYTRTMANRLRSTQGRWRTTPRTHPHMTNMPSRLPTIP